MASKSWFQCRRVLRGTELRSSQTKASQMPRSKDTGSEGGRGPGEGAGRCLSNPNTHQVEQTARRGVLEGSGLVVTVKVQSNLSNGATPRKTSTSLCVRGERAAPPLGPPLQAATTVIEHPWLGTSCLLTNTHHAKQQPLVQWDVAAAAQPHPFAPADWHIHAGACWAVMPHRRLTGTRLLYT